LSCGSFGKSSWEDRGSKEGEERDDPTSIFIYLGRRMHGDVRLGEEMVDCSVQRCLHHGGVRVLLSNMYASADKWEGVSKIRKETKDKNIRKYFPGCC